MSTRIARVADLAEQVRGVSYGKQDATAAPRRGYLPVLRAGNITEDGLQFDDLVFVPEDRISNKQMIRRNDVVIATSSGSLDVVGKAARALDDFDGGFGAFCKVLRPSSDVDAGYFAHFFRTRDYRQKVSALAAGANINNLRNEHLDEILIPLPPLPEQRRIADILDRADALRAQRRSTLAQLDSLPQAIFLEMFGNPTTNPLGFPRATLGEVIAAGPQNGLYKPASDYGSGTPILRIDAFYSGSITKLGALKRVRISEPERLAYGLEPGDIVINRVNSRDYLGKSAIVPQLPEDVIFESNMMRLRLDGTVIDPAFAIAYLQTQCVRNHFLRSAKDAVNQSSINQQDVKATPIYLPPLAMQRKFSERIVSVTALTARQQASFTELDALFASLQHRAFHGEM